MAVAKDASSTAANVSGTAVTTLAHNNLTVGASLSNGALIFFALTSTAPTGLTLNWDSAGTNQAMTNIGSLTCANSIAYIFGLRNPTSGNKTLTANWTTAGQCTLFGISFTGVSQVSDAAAFKNFNSATTNSATPSVTVTSNVGDAVVECCSGLFSTFGSSSQTPLFNSNAASAYNAGADWAVGASSVVIGETWSFGGVWACVGCDVASASAPPPPPPSPPMIGRTIPMFYDLAAPKQKRQSNILRCWNNIEEQAYGLPRIYAPISQYRSAKFAELRR